MEIKQMSVKDIVPYEKNAKKHPAQQVEHIANSIKEFGFQQPLVVDKNNVLVIGHGRLLAAKKLKMKEVPVVCAEDLTDEQIKALRLADNKTNESEWDLDFLGDELDDILNIDMSDFGFDILDDESDPVEIEEDEVPEEVETRCKLGDLWQLGRWVYCKKCGKKHYIS
jgi:site-specific DNA-methyltransferase (adenine-specific)